MSGAYYNEFDPFAAQWLRELIRGGHIAPGEVDQRSIEDVKPDDLAGFTQCHFFAGIGVWSYALRRAGWSDDAPIWTGSCPCQPFSAAGEGNGFADERHLWPAWFHLIAQCGPKRILGEQVASGDGLAWLDLIQTDLEAAGYAAGAFDLCAAGVGAPHIRQRLYFVADASGERLQRRGGPECRQFDENRQAPTLRAANGLAYPENIGSGAPGQAGEHGAQRANGTSRSNQLNKPSCGPTNGTWRDADWLYCRDDKWRPVEPGTSPLAVRASASMGRLRGYGNAIVSEVAVEVIRAYRAWLEE
jgi:DNA (cytosine-5)-methyltransferase 1